MIAMICLLMYLFVLYLDTVASYAPCSVFHVVFFYMCFFVANDMLYIIDKFSWHCPGYRVSLWDCWIQVLSALNPVDPLNNYDALAPGFHYCSFVHLFSTLF